MLRPIYTLTVSVNVCALSFPALRGYGDLFFLRGWPAPTTQPFTSSNWGVWTACRNVSAHNCRLGLYGMSATTRDPTAWMRIIPLGDSLRPFRFTRVRLFHPTDSLNMQVEVWPSSRVEGAQTHPLLGYTEYRIREPLDTLTFYLCPESQNGHTFTLFGVQFLNDDPGVIWHSVGVNGAATSSFLRCEYFIPHLKAFSLTLLCLPWE